MAGAKAFSLVRVPAGSRTVKLFELRFWSTVAAPAADLLPGEDGVVAKNIGFNCSAPVVADVATMVTMTFRQSLAPPP